MHYAADGTGVLHQRGARASELQPPLQWVRPQEEGEGAEEAGAGRAGKPHRALAPQPLHQPLPSPLGSYGGLGVNSQDKELSLGTKSLWVAYRQPPTCVILR